MAHRVRGRLITIADDLEDWYIEPELKQYIRRIETVYWFDDNLQVHLCEMAGSHELWPLETRAICDENTPDEVKDQIDGIVMGAAEYDVIYIHVADIRRRTERYRQMRAYLSFPTMGGQRYKPRPWEIADYCGVTYRKHVNLTLPLGRVAEYVDAVREAHTSGTLI